MTFQKYPYHHMLNTMPLTKRIFSFFKTKDHLSFTNLGLYAPDQKTRSEYIPAKGL